MGVRIPIAAFQAATPEEAIEFSRQSDPDEPPASLPPGWRWCRRACVWDEPAIGVILVEWVPVTRRDLEFCPGCGAVAEPGERLMHVVPCGLAAAMIAELAGVAGVGSTNERQEQG